MRRFVAWMLICLVALGAFGCSSEPEPSGGSKGEGGGLQGPGGGAPSESASSTQ